MNGSPAIAPLAMEPTLAVTVDLEEWFHICPADGSAPPGGVKRLDAGLDRLLGWLERYRVAATFFVLGDVASGRTDLIRRIDSLGHEVASHASSHRRLDRISDTERRHELTAGRIRLEDLVGRAVVGFRAPQWSIPAPGHSSLRMLADLGYRYDASMTPVPGLGARDNPTGPAQMVWPDGAAIVELPPLTGRFLGWRLPAGGAWTSRLFPSPWIAAAWAEAIARHGLVLLTVHPWEFDENPATDGFGLAHRLMHHAGLAKLEARLLEALGSGLPTRTLAQAVGELKGATRAVGETLALAH